MKMGLSKSTISRLTEGHKCLALALSAVLYLICITGTIAVFYMEMERWENPNLPEYQTYESIAVARAALDAQSIMIADKDRDPLFEDIYISLPSRQVPRIVAGYSDDARAYDSAGKYVGSANHPNTHFISELHYYLHLPESFGMIVVSILGIFMLALLIGGALAHKKMFQDAFKLRPRQAGHLGRADVHNRIGTWTLPFAFVVTATGSFVGFSQLIVFLVATVFYQGDFSKVMDPMLGAEKERLAIIQGLPTQGEAAIVTALAQLKAQVPDAIPTYLVFKKAATPTPSIEIIAKKSDRIIYGETYRFDSRGILKGQNGNLNGDIGKQIYASLFPLHFGNYGGLLIQIAYFGIGLTLCLMINAGMEIWFAKCAAKSNPRPLFHSAWVGFIYSSISAVAIAMTSNFLGFSMDVAIYWTTLALLVALSVFLALGLKLDILGVGRAMRCLLALSLIGLVTTHSLKFGAFNAAALSLNLPLLLVAIGILIPILSAFISHTTANHKG